MKIACLGATLALCLPALADTLEVTVTGTIAPVIFDGSSFVQAPLIDRNGVFGTQGASLTGDAFKVVWEIDTTCGGNCKTSFADYIVGGSFYGFGSPIISAALTIGGGHFDYGAGIFGVTQVYNSGYASGASVVETGNLNGLSLSTFIDSKAISIPDAFGNWKYTFDPTTDNLSHYLGIGGEFTLAFGDLSGYFLIHDMQFANLSAVPGPIIGSGLPGFVMLLLGGVWYRRRLAQ